MSSSPPAEGGDAAPHPRMHVAVVKKDLLAVAQIKLAIGAAGLNAEVFACQTAAAAVEHLRVRQAHLGIFGLSLPDLDGLDLIQRVCAARQVYRVLVVSKRHDERVRDVLRPGHVDGFFNPEVDEPGALVDAIRQTAEGRPYFSRDPFAAQARGPTLRQMFTPHQQKVLAALGDGSSDAAAAKLLKMRSQTVHTHRKHVMGKLEVRTSVELAKEAQRRGVVRITPEGVRRPGFEDELRG